MAGRRQSERGLTLIELVVAMSVVVMLITVTVMSADAVTGAKAKAATVELSGTIRSLYDTAALTGRTCRLVFQLPAERDEDGRVSYSAECAKGPVTADHNRDEVLREASVSTESRARETDSERKRRLEEDQSAAEVFGGGEPTLEDLMAQEKDRVEAAAKFQDFRDPQVKPQTFASNVRLSVWTRHQREAAKSGVAYLYFFPQGFTEKAQIGVRQGSNVWTISVAPLTGKTSVVDDELEVPK